MEDGVKGFLHREKNKREIAVPRWSEVFPFSSKMLLFSLLLDRKMKLLVCVKYWECSIFEILSRETSVSVLKTQAKIPNNIKRKIQTAVPNLAQCKALLLF